MTSANPPQNMTERIELLVKKLRADVPDCIAAGAIDMATGMLLSVQTVDNHPSEVLDLLAAATLELFQGRNVETIEEIWKERRGIRSNQHYFQEILVNSENLAHLFIRTESRDDIVIVVVCRKTVNVGMLFAQTRRLVRDTGRL